MLRKLLLLFACAALSAMPVAAEDNPCRVGTDISTECMEYTIELAVQGVMEAQFNLGLWSEMGTGMPIDKRAAAYWYRASAEQGFAVARFKLGQLYDTGEGVAVDVRAAAHWYRASAEQGFERAQLALGLMYLGGSGVIKDKREAYIWFLIAGAGGNEVGLGFSEAAEISGDISPKEIKSAKREARKRLQKIEANRVREIKP